MKKTTILTIMMLLVASSALAAENSSAELTITVLWLTAFLTAVIHTITGPDHYLPFIAIAKSRDFSLKKTLLWTFICGLGHIGSALLIALGFVYLSHFLTDTQFAWIEDNRSDLAAYALIGLGGAYLLWALRHRWLHKHGHAHHHGYAMHGGTEIQDKNITVYYLCFGTLRGIVADFNRFQRVGYSGGYQLNRYFLGCYDCHHDGCRCTRLLRHISFAFQKNGSLCS